MDAPQQIPTPETAPTDPITAYGISKLTIEKYLALHEHLYRSDYRVLRVTNPYGPFQTALKNQGVIAALISRAMSGESMEVWGDGSVVRDFIYIDDVIDALEAAMQDQSSHRVFNIGSGQGHSLREVIGMVERLAWQEAEHCLEAGTRDGCSCLGRCDRPRAGVSALDAEDAAGSRAAGDDRMVA